MGLLGEGFVVTVLKLMMDGFTEDGSVVTWRGVLKSLRGTQWQRIGPRHWEPLCCVVSVIFCLLSLHTRSCILQTLSFFFFFSGAGNDPEVAREHLFGCPRRHSSVPLLSWKMSSRSPYSSWTLAYSNFKAVSPALCSSMASVSRLSLMFTCSHPTALIAAPCSVTVWYSAQLLVGVTRILATIGEWSHRQVGRIPEAQDRFAWEGDVVVTRRGVLQFLMGALEVGSVVTWGGGPKFWWLFWEKTLSKRFRSGHVVRGSEVSDGSTRGRFCPRRY